MERTLGPVGLSFAAGDLCLSLLSAIKMDSPALLSSPAACFIHVPFLGYSVVLQLQGSPDDIALMLTLRCKVPCFTAMMEFPLNQTRMEPENNRWDLSPVFSRLLKLLPFQLSAGTVWALLLRFFWVEWGLQECILMTWRAPAEENNTGTHVSAIVAVQITELKCFG